MLQVFDNDVSDLFYYMRNANARDRKKRVYTPGAAERALLESVSVQPATPGTK